MSNKELLEAYKKVPSDELFKIINVVEDAIIRWESRVAEEPALRIRIRYGYECVKLVQQVLEERQAKLNDVELQ